MEKRLRILTQSIINQELSYLMNTPFEKEQWLSFKKLFPLPFHNFQVDHAILNFITMGYTSLRPVFLVQEDGFVHPYIDSICPKLRHVVGIFESIDTVHPINWKMLYGSTCLSRTKIVLWITRHADDDDIKSILKAFWSLDFLNVILVTMSDDSTNHGLAVHSYDPFWVNKGGVRGKVYTLAVADLLYPNKMKNLQGYPIAVSMYDTFLSHPVTNISQLRANSDVELLLSLSSWLNFTIDLRSRPISTAEYYRMKSPNGTVVGIIYDLITNYSEVLGNSHIWGKASDRVEFLLPHARFISEAVVPMPEVIPEIICIFKSFDVMTFILLILFSFISVIYMYSKGTNAPVLNTFRLIIHHQFYQVGTRVSEKVLAISWIVFAGLFLLIQQSHLIENMTNPLFEKRIDTLKQLADSDLTVMTDAEHFPLLNRSRDEVMQKIVSRITTKHSSRYCYERLIAGGNVACFLNTVIISSVRSKPEITQSYLKIPKMHKMREIVGQYWRAIIVKKGFPYLSKFNAGIGRLMQTGFVTKWQARDRERLKPRVIHADDAVPLNLSHFRGPFIIFLFGIVVATCAFIYEIVIYRVKY
ncbi:uncharacterized protein LOC114841598 [Diachasma alloeum]|uniref:Ionotropic receptor 138 n=1 Tax=Diachasma alloeum TaxID=454923 RepID=A0A4E0RN49_9HYME|nr:uncharacterized protein LOC114841598 [Diachasma alloeum]THK33218.1 ionotropic receptor 138 [Diachasma alloeum]